MPRKDLRWQLIDLPEPCSRKRKARATPAHLLLGRFEIHEEIGSGGMATVHRATEWLPNGSTREVAIKRPKGEGADKEVFKECLVHEASIMKSLNHPNVIRTYESGPLGDSFFISMEYVAGHSLNQLLRAAAGRIPPAVIVSLLRDLCGALDHIHNAKSEDGEPLGLIHRDISPANLLVDRQGRLRVLDFGIAKASLASEHTANLVKGKLGYLAPEAITRSEPLDAQTDLFSVGIIAHELLSGRPLFTTKSAKGTVARALTAVVRPPSDYNSACPHLLDSVVLKALTRTRANRAQTAAELHLVLDAIAESLLPGDHRMVAEWFQGIFTDDEKSRARLAKFSKTIATAIDFVPEEAPRHRRALTFPLRPLSKSPFLRRTELVTFRRSSKRY